MATNFEAIYKACKISERIFVLHPKFRRVNFYSQQLRALALVEGLQKFGHLKPGKRNVAVVGRGITGLTASAALATLKANVVSIDRAPDLNIYWNVIHRELHPNIILWPFQQLRPITNLPFLNWSCNTASAVRNQIMEQWERSFADVVPRETEEVVKIEESASGVRLHFKSGKAALRSDAVIVATGFLRERPQDVPNLKRYWSLYNFDEGTDVVVAGSGDGGLIDAAAQFFSVRAVAASRALAYAMEELPTKEDIAEVEGEATRLADQGDLSAAHKRLESFYSRLYFQVSTTKMLSPLMQRGRKVRLVHKDETPYPPYAAPINKLLLAFCRRTFPGDIVVEQGSLDIAKRPFAPELTIAGSTTVADKDTLLVRVGADAAVNSLLSDAQKQALEQNERDHNSTLGAVVEDEYNFELYSRNPPRSIAPPSDGSEFLDVLTKLLQALLAHVDGGLLGAQVVRATIPPGDNPSPEQPTVQISVMTKGKLEDFARCLFPTRVQNVIIDLGKTAPRFTSLGGPS